jgi:hypothetical protein
MPTKRIVFSLMILMFGLSACQAATPTASQPVSEKIAALATNLPTAAAAITSPGIGPEQTATTSPEPTGSAPLAIGPNPEDIPLGYNPLTGLPAADPATLKLPAVLVSITNFPASARPQAGLSFSPWVYEIYIAEGMTRYLATFYGDYPKIANSADLSAPTQAAGSQAGAPQKRSASAEVGPVRSGRLAYVYIRDFFQNSCLVYAGATEQIRARLRGCAMVYGDDSKDINSAMLDVTRLQKIAEQNQRDNLQFNYSGSLFTANPQTQGPPASQINVYYSYLNQAQWQYDPASGAYLKFDDFADGSGKFTPASDRLNGQQLAFSNVVVLFSEHTVLNPYIIDVNMGPGERGKAIIFRDGQKFDATWSTVAGAYEQATGLRRPLRFEDANGQPFALKPGHTWVHIVTPASEVLDQGAGLWNLRFYAPAGAK